MEGAMRAGFPTLRLAAIHGKAEPAARTHPGPAWTRSAFVLPVLACGLFGPLSAHANVIITTGGPVAVAAGVTPTLTITAFNNAVPPTPFPITITLTNGMTANQKATAIAAAIIDAANGAYPGYNTKIKGQAAFPYRANQDAGAGSVTITGTNSIKFGPDNTGEGINKANMGVKGVLADASFGGSGTATGDNGSGGTSVVSVGIEGEFIATDSRTSGESFLSVLDDLAVELDDNSIPVAVDPTDDTLTLDDPIAGNVNFDFGSTDTGLTIFGDYAAVPEPSTALLLGCLALGFITLHRFASFKR
jgi:hypothetical protein